MQDINYRVVRPTADTRAFSNSLDKRSQLIGSSIKDIRDSVFGYGDKLKKQSKREYNQLKDRNTQRALMSLKSSDNQKELENQYNSIDGSIVDYSKVNNTFDNSQNFLLGQDEKQRLFENQQAKLEAQHQQEVFDAIYKNNIDRRNVDFINAQENRRAKNLEYQNNVWVVNPVTRLPEQTDRKINEWNKYANAQNEKLNIGYRILKEKGVDPSKYTPEEFMQLALQEADRYNKVNAIKEKQELDNLDPDKRVKNLKNIEEERNSSNAAKLIYKYPNVDRSIIEQVVKSVEEDNNGYFWGTFGAKSKEKIYQLAEERIKKYLEDSKNIMNLKQ